MRRRLAIAPFFKSASVATALVASPLLAQAASVQTVFSAENALYGAGYNIGQADGWIDDSLRAAVRQYQSDRPNLKATGELDAQTLGALGISGGKSQLMGGNVVATREAARSELGLTLASAPKPTAKAVPEPEPEPEQPAAAPEPVAEPEPVVSDVAKVSKPAAQPEPEKAPEPAPQAAPAPVEKPEPAQVAQAKPETTQVQSEPETTQVQSEPETTQVQSEPEPTSEPIKIASTVRSRDKGEPSSAPAPEETADEPVKVASVSNSEDADPEMPQEPTSSGVDQEAVSSGADNNSQPEEESQGNVLTKIFDFLFGWMV